MMASTRPNASISFGISFRFFIHCMNAFPLGSTTVAKHQKNKNAALPARMGSGEATLRRLT